MTVPTGIHALSLTPFLVIQAYRQEEIMDVIFRIYTQGILYSALE